MRSLTPILSPTEHRTRMIISIASVVIYTIAFVPLYYAIGGGDAAALALLPAALAGWYLGLRWGTLLSLVAVAVSLIFYILLGTVNVFISRGAAGALIVIILGAGAGWLSDLLQKLRDQTAALQKEIGERKQAEALVQAANQTVSAQNHQLERINELF